MEYKANKYGKKRIVIALGGNAILQRGEKGTFEEQYRNVMNTAEHIADLILSGKYQVVITHGNGPQVGAELLRHEAGEKMYNVPAQPMDVAGAMTQGQIGYMIQQALINILTERGRPDIPVATVVTQVLVDKDDPAFQNPTKPVGPFYDEETAKKLAAEKGWVVKEDAGRGWRRVVPSPDPKAIVEADAINALLDKRVVVIASGGGGIPVIKEDGKYKGVEAVIDKDLAGERLAEAVDADVFMILTDVDGASIYYRTPQEKWIKTMPVEEAKRYYQEGHFKAGSMGPKVLATIRFVEYSGKEAYIAKLGNELKALRGEAGTKVVKEGKLEFW